MTDDRKLKCPWTEEGEVEDPPLLRIPELDEMFTLHVEPPTEVDTYFVLWGLTLANLAIYTLPSLSDLHAATSRKRAEELRGES